jgi:murein DD-endopeptidase MepM/ murein hydrolase activator NlpD
VFPLPQGTGTRTSGFGYRIHPVTGERKLHAGVDYAAPEGTPVLALADGVVTYAGPDPYAGNLLVLKHTIRGELIDSAYAHLANGSTQVSTGDRVVAGQHVAAVGSTGRSTGPHLHFELHPDGFHRPAIDPEPWLAAHQANELDQDAVVGSHQTCHFLRDLSE